MNSLIEKITGLDKMSDQMIATDMLIAAKSGVQNYSIALTETTSPEVRKILRNQLDDAITIHEVISMFMVKRGYYFPYDMKQQYEVDMNTTDTTLKLMK